MKSFPPLLICCGLMLSGCDDSVDEPNAATAAVVTSDDFIKEKAAAIKAIERPVLVTQGPLPKAVAEKTEFNFGRMALGGKSQTTFEIRNDGESELELEAGSPTCQCTAFSLSTEKVAPGEASILTVSWDAKIVDSAFQHGGPVYTNDPNRDVLKFVVMGRVGVDYELQPSEKWNAGEAKEDSPATVSGVLFSSVNEDFEIERIESNEDFITADFRKLNGSELADVNGIAGFEIMVAVKPEFEPGEMEWPIQIYLKGREDPISTIVTARRMGPIRVLPTPGAVYTREDKSLRMGSFSAEEGKEVSLMLLVEELDEPLLLEKIASSPSFLKVELKPMGKDHRRYLLKVSIPAGVQKGGRDTRHPAQIQIETNHPEHKSLDINVTYRAS